jgi:predicted nuclease of restriction endonuclease-like (RecB) superfamily
VSARFPVGVVPAGGAVSSSAAGQPPYRELPLTWYHHITLLEKVKDEQERLWYIQQAIEHGWSRNVLWHHIDTRLFHRKGKAVTNFPTTLPALTSDLAASLLKDPYVFDFITTSDEHKERHVQQALLANIRRFLLELGVGFTFVGSNYHIVVGGEDTTLTCCFITSGFAASW